MSTISRRAAGVRLLALSLAVATVAALTACGGGDGGSSAPPPPPPPPPPPAFALQDTDPADGAAGVSRGAVYAATLTAAASAPTVTSGTVAMAGPEGNAIPANVSSSGTSVTLVPAAGALPGDTTYTVTFAATIEDITGRALGSAQARTFTTASSAWGATAADVAAIPDFNSVGQPAIAYDAAGNLLVAWHAAGFATDTLYAARRDAATGAWGAPITIETLANGAIAAPALACGGAGDCYLAWTHWQSGAYRTVQMARFDGATSTWQAPAAPPFTALSEDVSDARPVFDAGGNLSLLATTSTRVMALHLDTATQAWGALLTYVLGSPSMEVHAVMDPAGDISVAWVHDGPSSRWVYGNHYDAGAGAWSAEQPIDDMVNTAMTGSLWMALDGTNAATVAFSRGGFIAEVNASRLDPATGLWGTSTRLDTIDPAADSAYAPQVVGDAAGYVTSVWRQNSGLWSSRFSPATGTWSAPVAMSATYGATGGLSGTFLVADVAGNVTATWSNDFGTSACRWLVKDGAWGAVTDISVPASGSRVFTSRTLQATAGATGDVAVAWYQQDDVDGSPAHRLDVGTLH